MPITFHRIEKIKLRLSNAYLVLGNKPILVDTGSAGEAKRICEALELHDLTPSDLSLILLTHSHGDHAGSAAELRRMAPNVPIAIHPMDVETLRSGQPEELHPTCTFGRVLKRFANEAFEGLEADVLLQHGQDLSAYGICGHVLHTPGHTPGSCSVLLKSGEALMGDVLMGGAMGGNLWPSKPGFHYFADNCEANRQSLQAIMAHKPNRVYVGHGGPLDGERVLDWMRSEGIEILTLPPKETLAQQAAKETAKKLQPV